jgi:hypothetical protein
MSKKVDKFTKLIIKLDPKKSFWIFGLIYPLFIIWLYTIGLFVLAKTERSNSVFKFISFTYILLVFGSFISISSSEIVHDELYNNLFVLIPLMTIPFFLIGVVSKAMIDYENRDNEYFSGNFRRFHEYLLRFFHLLYFPFSIYWIQQKVNLYE